MPSVRQIQIARRDSRASAASTDKPRILIVGGGIAGLALAVGLERLGFTPTIVEIADSVLSRGRGLLLTSNALLALRQIGLDNEVIKRGVVQERQSQTDALGTPISDYDFRAMNSKYAPNLGVTREGLMDGLLSGLWAQVQLSTTIAKLERLAGALHVTFSDGTLADYDVVVGSDGIKSGVRSLICLNVVPVYRSFCAWRTLIECRDFDSDGVVIRLGPGCVLGAFKVTADILYAFVLAHEPGPLWSSPDPLEQLKELAGRFRGRASSLISRPRDPDRVIFVPVQEVDTVPYYRRRVVLIGDAAHALVPQFAQGAAMAIQDGVVLAQLLGSCADLEQALASYESSRRRRIDFVRAQVRHRAVLQGMDGLVTPELLKRHPPLSANPEAIYPSLLEGAL